MSKIIIGSKPDFKRERPNHNNYLDIAEFFCDTIQGEGVYLGHPAAFLRVQGCTQSCVWCDSQEVWTKGNPYTFQEIFSLMEDADLIRKLQKGQHLVFTGGSPLRVQDKIASFLEAFWDIYEFTPFVEIENECVLTPINKLSCLVGCWNNSPKLAGSGNDKVTRYRPEVIKWTSELPNSWFKFVVSCEADWEEIKRDFLDRVLIRREQVILMPLGAGRTELESNREFVVNLAIREGVRYSTREHTILWDKQTGV